MDAPKNLSFKDIRARFAKPARILEVGFGDGEFIARLCQAGHTVAATEVSDRMVKETSDKIPEAAIYLSNQPSEIEGPFDAVCCFEVLEHVSDPISLARQFPASLLYASVPNSGRWYPRLTKRYEYWDYPPNHLWRFCDCEPLGADHHESDCKLGDLEKLAENQRGMSVRWLLQQAGYTKIKVSPTPVQAHDLLRMIPIRSVSGDYDNMRRRSKLGVLTAAGRRLVMPATLPAAGVLNLMRQSGVSFYITATRE